MTTLPEETTQPPPTSGEQNISSLLEAEPVDWEALTNRVKSHPEEARRENPSLLHNVIPHNPPLEALETVIDADRKELEKYFSTDDGISPFGLARISSLEVVQLILRETIKYKESEPGKIGWKTAPQDIFTKMIHGRPFEGLPLDFMRALLEVYPQGVLERDCRPTMRLFSRIELVVGRSMHRGSDYWEKLNLVLKAAVCGTVKDTEQTSNFLVLHAFLQLLSGMGPFKKCWNHLEFELGLVVSILKIIKDKVPEQFRARDGGGYLPLHIAVRNRHCRSIGFLYDESYASDLICFLLKEYPESAGVPDGQGRLPLHVAMEYNHPRFEIIANAEPRALHTRCMVTHMYPFQLVGAEDSSEWMQKILLSKVYTLLRKGPRVARGMAKDVWKLDTPQYKTIVRNELKIAKIQSQNANLKRELARISTQRENFEDVNNDA
jgi:hypothetical protein